MRVALGKSVLYDAGMMGLRLTSRLPAKEVVVLVGMAALIQIIDGAEPIGLVEAAELATAFLEEEELEGKKLSDWFLVGNLLKEYVAEGEEPGLTVIWRAYLRDRGEGQEVSVSYMEDGKEFSRMLEILSDGTGRLSSAKVATGRRRIVLPRPIPRSTDAEAVGE
jgi:hypothetical protein